MKFKRFLSAATAAAMLMVGVSTSAFAAGKFKSDTTMDFSVKPNSSYTFKITADGTNESPNFVIGTPGVFTSKLTGKSGDDYFYKITAVGKSGASAGVYVSGQRVCVATVAGNSIELAAGTFKSDTTTDFSVKPNSSYTFKITTNGTAPTFTLGTSGVFTSKLTERKGNDYFYKITAVGKSGASTGIYVSGKRICVATISGASSAKTLYKDYTRPFNVDAILKDMIAAGEARGMVYTPEFKLNADQTANASYRMPDDKTPYYPDENDPTFDYSYWLKKNCTESVTGVADRAVKIEGTSQGVRFKPLWVKQDNGEYLIYVLYG